MNFWIVTLDGREIDRVPYSADCDSEYVRRSLIDHDGYDARITVCKQREQRTIV